MQSGHHDSSNSPESSLVTYLQALVEHDKASLVRELHDDLGGLMVAAVMDVIWAEEHLSSTLTRGRLARVRETLRSAIELKRKIIEGIRPSLLDNVGLFAALSWELRQTCTRAGLHCTEEFPPTELHFTDDAAIALFRIAQEALAISNHQVSATKAEFCVSTERETVILRIATSGNATPIDAIDCQMPVFASMLHRIQALGGNLTVASSPPGGIAITIAIPQSQALRPGT